MPTELPAGQDLLDSAVQCYGRQDYQAALALTGPLLERDSENIEAINLAGACARQLGHYDEAQAYFRRAIAIQPDYANAHSNLGNLFRDLKRLPEAEAAYRRAIVLSPSHPDALFHLGSLCQTQGRATEAETTFRQLLAVVPSHANAFYNLGLLLRVSGRNIEAVDAFERMLALRPDYADAYTNLGNIYAECAEFAKALAAYRRAAELAPKSADAHYNLGTFLEKQTRFADAQAAYQTALRLNPDHVPARWKLGHVQRYLCIWPPSSESAGISKQLGAIPVEGTVSPFELLADPAITPMQQRQAAQAIAAQRGYASLAGLTGLPEKSPSAPLRIGYLSADFYDHATTRLLAGVLEQHDRGRYAVFAYAYGPVINDPARERVARACVALRDLSTLSDQAAAETISADGIDILVELKGYTSGSRLGISARRPAPLIVSWLGYPGTLGEPKLADYIIGDPVVTPIEHVAHFSETLALMPHSYQPNDRSRELGTAPSRSEVGLPDGAIVFCCFNQSYKLNPQTFDVWCRLLIAVPNSVLWLLESTATAKVNLEREAQMRGVAATRLIFAPYNANPGSHLQRLQCADLALDTYPYGSHTTGSDALWAGVPMLTRLGETFASRVAGSLLNAVGLPELVTQTWEQYFDLARALALDRGRLAGVREKLARQRLVAPLFDTVRFTRDLERLYDRMWQDHTDAKREPIVLADTLGAAHTQRASGQWQNAITLYQEFVAQQPQAVDAWVGLSLCFEELGNIPAARDALKSCLKVRPQTAFAHHRLGWLAYRQKQFTEALAHYQQAIHHAPNWFEAHYHAAVCYQELRRYPEAITHYQNALRCKADLAPIWYHAAKALKDGGHLETALPVYLKALELQPDYADARYSLGLLHLLRGDWLLGWQGYEQRWQGSDRAGSEHRPATNLPLWQGEEVAPNSGIVVYAEQGMGDTIMCFRYAELLKVRFARVKFAVTAPLVILFRYSAPAGVEVVTRIRQRIDEAGYTHYIHTLSLPAAFKTTPENVPAKPYLQAPADRVSCWQQRLAAQTGPRVGLVWMGGKLSYAPARDMAFANLAPLLELPGICWYSLQKDGSPPKDAPVTDWMAEVADFADTAALIANLDLVIAVDTAVAHLAGAMGKPVWLLNRFESEWRWMRGKDTTPWYPSMRIFSQTAPGDWGGVVDQVAAILRSQGSPDE